jgi:hypothetical protein
VNFDEGVFRGSGKAFIVVGEAEICDSGAVRDERFCQRFVSFSTEEGNRSIVVSELDRSYSPPARNSTEFDLSQLPAQY